MSKRKARISDFQASLEKILDDYGDSFTEKIQAAVHEAAKVAQKETKAGSPTRTGKYKRGWAIKETKGRLGSEAIIHNRTSYQLAHLLEKGHAMKCGGRTVGNVKSFPHIKPAEEHAIENIEKAVEKFAKQG